MPLVRQTENRQSKPIKFAGHNMQLDARGVLYWPAESCLIVSDLHLEKGSFLRQFAHPVPGYDTKDSLARLGACINDYQPKQLVCLGDSFHDRHGVQRLKQHDVVQIHALVQQVKHWVWVLGNHDPALPGSLPGEQVPFLTREGICLTHEPMDTIEPQVIGHFHPKFRRRVGGQKLSGRCFLYHQHRLMMPAFGAYTGGLSVNDPAIGEVMGPEFRCMLMMQDKLWPVSVK